MKIKNWWLIFMLYLSWKPGLSGRPHLTTLVQCTPPAASPAPGHSEAGLTPSLFVPTRCSLSVPEIRSLYKQSPRVALVPVS